MEACAHLSREPKPLTLPCPALLNTELQNRTCRVLLDKNNQAWRMKKNTNKPKKKKLPQLAIHSNTQSKKPRPTSFFLSFVSLTCVHSLQPVANLPRHPSHLSPPPLLCFSMITPKATAALAVVLAATAQAATPTTSYLPQTSPPYLSNITLPTGVIKSWPVATAAPSGPLGTGFFTNYTFPGYPVENEIVTAAATDPNIIAAMALIDWTKVPDAPVTTTASLTSYNSSDPYCWWTYSTCVTPKIDYIPPDIYLCPQPGTWGLTYDDGPLFYWPFTPENEVWAEPNLYNYLLAHNNQKANLFYIASNILGAPDAAQRGLNDGHVVCVHTWSHPSMTQLTNAEVVAEFYYSLMMIKQVLGITPRCWRPPYGDVDDRVRSIAWQMGMRTIIWDLDTNDWNIPGDQTAGGTVTYAAANATVAGWMEQREIGNDTTTGHICLEHELSNSTIALAEFWLPTIQKNYQTMPATACNNIAQPYWETDFIYPIQGSVALGVDGNPTGLVISQANGSSTTSSAASATGTTVATASHSNAAAGHAAELKTVFLGAMVAAVAAAAHSFF